MKLTFLGAARQVTGSCYLVEAGGLRILVDCGMFQERDLLFRNWAELTVDTSSIDFVLLTHAHLDHAGLLPRRFVQGLRCPILTTRASADLARIVLLDAAEIQEEDAAFKKRRHEREGRTGPYPVAPLYTRQDARGVLEQLTTVPYEEPVALNERVSVRFRDAGHILGSALIELTEKVGAAGRRLVFSGDLGLWNKPIIPDPTLVDQADYVVMESTYGDRDHAQNGPIGDRLADIVNETVRGHGNLLIPTFAIERAQELMFHFAALVRAKRIPRLLVFLDSPMAVRATDVFPKYPESLDAEMRQLLASGRSPFEFPGLKLVRTRDESKALNGIRGSVVIMAGSGMCTAGRIKHHLSQQIGRRATTVLFVGYQAVGTLGRQILEGRKQVRILGQNHRVRANIEQMQGFSAHADQSTLMRWASHLKSPPRKVFLTHGEPEAAAALLGLVQGKLGFDTTIPDYGQSFELA